MASRLNNPKSPRVTTPTPPHQANSSPYRTPRNVASAAIKPVLKSSHQVVRNTNRLDREDDCYADLHPGITVTVKFFSARFCGREPFAVIRQRDRSDHDYADIGHFPDLGQQLTWRLWWEHTAMLVEEARGGCDYDLAEISQSEAGQIAAGLAAGHWPPDAARLPWVASTYPR